MLNILVLLTASSRLQRTCKENLTLPSKPVFLAKIVRFKNYRFLSQVATYWCPDQEENGYFLALVSKCITNPREVTAYRW
ncbi:hypothetical protein EDD17DRAFT_1679324 [Pisolithus thermaeus]|nr:hypothetical protein EV401DRAFT_2051267 [Pisolithus croceorrhizus]KAI6137430.1 hypothetical protein EDD17DRAFT_1680241 [Pisolithus thermaeus]KAI6137462.1 hypothetical protein EDD17DRAFT_1679324 [Pisolithus thermaeus]